MYWGITLVSRRSKFIGVLTPANVSRTTAAHYPRCIHLCGRPMYVYALCVTLYLLRVMDLWITFSYHLFKNLIKFLPFVLLPESGKLHLDGFQKLDADLFIIVG